MSDALDQQVRDDEEIVRYYENVKANDVFGVWGTELLMRVPFSKALRFLKADHGWDEESWEKSRLKNTKEQIMWEMEDYFQFALEKAITHRGLSASRTVHHYMVWAWLINDMELFAYFMDGRNYPNYGAPLLLAYAQKYEALDLVPDNLLDREVFLRMARGEMCSDMCPGGCGRGRPAQFREFKGLPPPQVKLIIPK